MSGNVYFCDMKRIVFLLIVMVSLCAAQAELRVDSFEARPMDLSARTHERLDRNGNPCALVKVELPVEGCKFEGNVLHTFYDVNEYWVYLSGGTKMLNIKCPGERNLMVIFGEISDIQSVEGSNTYVLGTSGYTVAGGSAAVDPGASYLIIDIEPKSANPIVKIDGAMQPVEDGQVMAFVPYGPHEYAVEAIGYRPESGSANVVRGENTPVTVRLQSTKASLSVDTETTGATIKINGQIKGTGSWSGELSPGTYSVEAAKDGHKPNTVTVTLAENDSRRVTVPALTAIYGGLNVGYRPIGADVYIDGHKVGTTPYLANDITAGRHTVRVAKDGYTDYTTTVDIAEGQISPLNGSLSQGSSSHNQVSAPDTETETANLDLCATRGGKPYFFSESEWKGMPVSEQSKYKKKGLVVIDGNERFLLDLDCSEPITWDKAVKKYGEDRLPGEAQCRAISKQFQAIKSAIVAFGGTLAPEHTNWLWGKSKNASSGWLVSIDNGKMSDTLKTNHGLVRTVAPVPR